MRFAEVAEVEEVGPTVVVAVPPLIKVAVTTRSQHVVEPIQVLHHSYLLRSGEG